MDRGGGHPRGPSNSRPYRGKLYCIRKPRARARRADPAGSIKDVASALYARGSRPTMDWPVLPAGVVTRSAASTLGTANPCRVRKQSGAGRERGCCGRAVSVEIRQTAGCSAFRAGPLLVAGPSAPGRAQTSLGGCRGASKALAAFSTEPAGSPASGSCSRFACATKLSAARPRIARPPWVATTSVHVAGMLCGMC